MNAEDAKVSQRVQKEYQKNTKLVFMDNCANVTVKWSYAAIKSKVAGMYFFDFHFVSLLRPLRNFRVLCVQNTRIPTACTPTKE